MIRDKYIFNNIENCLTQIPKNYDGDRHYVNSKTKKTITKKIKTNSYGFRSDNFIKIHDACHIVFSGCSETFGTGGSDNESWPKILFDLINYDNRLSGYFNLGVPGAGYQDIFSILIDYINNFNKPDIIFILFPNLGRTIRWCDKKNSDVGGGYFLLYENKNKLYLKNKNTKYHWNENDYNNEFVQFSLTMKVFEKMCELNNIKLFWSTWDINFLNIILKNKIIFKNFYDLNISNDEINKIYNNGSLTLKKVDDHLGTMFHTHWANKFYDYFIASDGIIDNKEE